MAKIKSKILMDMNMLLSQYFDIYLLDCRYIENKTIIFGEDK